MTSITTHGTNKLGKYPNGKILKTDVSIAKNYLSADELDSLGRIVSAYLELAEGRAKHKIPINKTGDYKVSNIK